MEKMFMGQVMSHFGMVEEIEIFAKFAFVKYKSVLEATLAF